MTALTTAGLDKLAIGLRILAAMKRGGLRKSDVRKAVGVSWQAVNDWTKGKTLPDRDHLRELARVLRVTPEQLLGVAAGQEPPFPSWATFVATAEGQSMTPDERRELAGHPWIERTPSVVSYLLLLTAIRSAPTN